MRRTRPQAGRVRSPKPPGLTLADKAVLARVERLAATIERFHSQPYIQGGVWALRQARRWRQKLQEFLPTLEPKLKRYTEPIKARVDALPWGD